MTAAEKEKVFRNAMRGLPGSDKAFTSSPLLLALKTYEVIGAAKLKDHLYYFSAKSSTCCRRMEIKNGHTSR